MKTKLPLFILLLLAGLSSAFAQVTVNFTVDMTGQTIGSGGMHVAGQFATAGSTTITQDWQPDAAGSEMTLLGNNVYSVNVDFPEAAIGTTIQFLFVRNNVWVDGNTDFSEGNAGETSLNLSCGVEDGVGGYNRTLTIPVANASFITSWDQCGSLSISQCAGAIQIKTLGSAGNILSTLGPGVQCLSYDQHTNSLVFIHRNNPIFFGGTNSTLRYDYSTDGGTSWTNDIGTLAPDAVAGVNGARYPQVLNYNPTSGTDFSNDYIVFHAPTTGADWNGYVTGVSKGDGTGITESFNQAGVTNTNVPTGLCQGAPGTFWTVDGSYSLATGYTGIRVLKGTFTNNDVSWEVNAELFPSFNTSYSGFVQLSDFNIAFDPSGTYGWIALLTHLTSDDGAYVLHPVFYSTTNGGDTWSGPVSLDLLQFSSVNQYIAYPATTAFDLDITVDHLGHPHTLVVVGQGDLSSPYSIITSGLHIYDVTNNGTQWQAIHLSAVSGLRGQFSGTLGLSHDNDPQISRSKDGKLLSFFWTDTYLGEGSNNLPNLYGCNYSAAMNLMSGAKDYTSCSDFNGRIYFPRASCDLVSLGDGQYEAPIVFMQTSASGLDTDPAYYYYIDDLKVNACEFTGTPSVFISSNTGSFESCPGTALTLSTFNDPAYSYQWNKDGSTITGATNASIIISASGNYSITASNPHGCASSAGPVPVSFECPQPGNLTAFNITNSSAELAFTGTDCAELYRIRYHDINGGAWIYIDITGTSTALNNLSTATTYEVEAETFCNESLTDSSGYTDPILITTGSGCLAATNLAVSLVSFSKAMLSWTPSAGASGYRIGYRIHGTSVWTVKNVSGSNVTAILTDLKPETIYDWRLMTSCGAEVSLWSPIQHFKTDALRVGNETVATEIQVYPNPSNGNFKLSFQVPENESVQIGIYDLTGMLVKKLEPSNESVVAELNVNATDLSSGVYFVKAFTPNHVTIRKIEIVK